MPPEVNLLNEKNNGEAILELINTEAINAIHDVSTGGIISALAEMSISSQIGVKINKPKKLSNIFEYFFGEDQGRYLIEIDKNNYNKIEKILKDASISSNSNIRKAAITALTSRIDTLNADENKDLLSNASSDDDSEIRAEVATLLGGLEDVDWAKPLLISNLNDPDSWVRKNSALSLIKLNAIEAVETLEQRETQEEDQIVANVIKLAIQKLKQKA